MGWTKDAHGKISPVSRNFSITMNDLRRSRWLIPVIIRGGLEAPCPAFFVPPAKTAYQRLVPARAEDFVAPPRRPFPPLRLLSRASVARRIRESWPLRAFRAKVAGA